ncbi:SBBP repeat-containing protein [Sandaracinus amylolyticus]|nr:SBBP repeat-containing protein [Sandaracinus amylolyticus]
MARRSVLGITVCAALVAAGCGDDAVPAAPDAHVVEHDAHVAEPDASTPCPPGTVRGASACEPCGPGEHCPGGDAPAEPCVDAWDHDEDASTACVAWIDCAPGEHVGSVGTATSDRACATCAEATFSTSANAPSCTPWTTCAEGMVEVTPGSSTRDRTCAVGEWTRQLGSTAGDLVGGVAVDAGGNVYVAGSTYGALPEQTSAGGTDAFLVRYDASGAHAWTRQLGTSSGDLADDVAVDAAGDVYVAGTTPGALHGQTSAGGTDAFVVRYDASGTAVWTRQLGAVAGNEHGHAVAVDASGNVFLAGVTSGTFPGETRGGSSDAFVASYDASGTLRWTRQLGSTGNEQALGVAVDASGNAYVVGHTDGTLPGQTRAGDNDLFVARYDASGTLAWTRQLGSTDGDSARDVAVDATGHAYVTGYTLGALPEQTSVGGADAFLLRFDASGTLVWTRQLGSTGYDVAQAVAVDAHGNAYVVGETLGVFPGQTNAGNSDAFVAHHDASGALLRSQQLGTTGPDYAHGVAVGSDGGVHVAGDTGGTFPDQTNAGGTDLFVARILP